MFSPSSANKFHSAGNSIVFSVLKRSGQLHDSSCFVFNWSKMNLNCERIQSFLKQPRTCGIPNGREANFSSCEFECDFLPLRHHHMHYFFFLVRCQAWELAPSSGKNTSRPRQREVAARGAVWGWSWHRTWAYVRILHLNKSRAPKDRTRPVAIGWKIGFCWCVYDFFVVSNC